MPDYTGVKVCKYLERICTSPWTQTVLHIREFIPREKPLHFKEGGKPTPLEIINIKCYVFDVVSSFLKTKIQKMKILV